jgi:hypothetical protein
MSLVIKHADVSYSSSVRIVRREVRMITYRPKHGSKYRVEVKRTYMNTQ